MHAHIAPRGGRVHGGGSRGEGGCPRDLLSRWKVKCGSGMRVRTGRTLSACGHNWEEGTETNTTGTQDHPDREVPALWVSCVITMTQE